MTNDATIYVLWNLLSIERLGRDTHRCYCTHDVVDSSWPGRTPMNSDAGVSLVLTMCDPLSVRVMVDAYYFTCKSESEVQVRGLCFEAESEGHERTC